ncbi:putative short chain dehydrogenase/reductase [Biscogniauxia sp. FL1348]|nr:putative short chain dehydrogenase/reductase [Biscogniauxia sp. FL1348]
MTNSTVILVTGANSGIGYETVIALATVLSDSHILLGSRTLEKGERPWIDVTDKESINTVKEHIDSQFGKLDVLINNAGIVAYQTADKLTALRQTFETNVFGQAILTEALEPLMKKATKPYIIYISSGQGSVTLRLDPEDPHRNVRGDAYRMSKSALNMLAACQRYNYAEWGCRVLAFNPGWCISNLTGVNGREARIKGGARDPREPAIALVDIVLGKRDDDIEKNGMVNLDGGILPW